MPAPNFRMGTEEAEKASARTQFIRTGYLSIDEGQSAIVRLLTDHNNLVTVQQHNNAPTRPKPANHNGKWPQSMPAVCRADKAFREFDYPDCFLDVMYEKTGSKRDYKPTSRSWGLAVVRKKIMREGKFVGFEDEMVEIVDADKNKVKIPRIVTLNYSWLNFWNNFNAMKETQGTWLSNDVLITRSGKEVDTTYSVAPYPQVGLDGLQLANTESKDEDGNVIAFDPRNMDHAAKYITAIGLDPKQFQTPGEAFKTALGTLVAERASDEFYARFFDTRVEQPESSVVPADHVDKPADDMPSEEALQAMAARVGAHPTPEAPAALGFE